VRSALIAQARWLGVFLSAVGLGFLVWRWQATLAQAPTIAWTTLVPRVALATLVYALAGLPLAVGWWYVLRACGQSQIGLRAAARGHLRAQVAKYIPGNIFHFALRHADARQRGGVHAPLAAASLLESASLILAASLWIAFLPPQNWPESWTWLADLRWAPAMLGVASLLLARPLLRRWLPVASRHLSALWLLVGCHVIFFGLANLSFGIVFPDLPLSWSARGAVLALCWLGGFLSIGAPGGLGVREALVLLLLTPAAGEAAALSGAIAFRFATLGGDAMASLLGSLWPAPTRHIEAP
jgi:hypothetical protein